jgi:hypothetical protein
MMADAFRRKDDFRITCRWPIKQSFRLTSEMFIEECYRVRIGNIMPSFDPNWPTEADNWE